MNETSDAERPRLLAEAAQLWRRALARLALEPAAVIRERDDGDVAA
jgi:hypothetical protein